MVLTIYGDPDTSEAIKEKKARVMANELEEAKSEALGERLNQTPAPKGCEVTFGFRVGKCKDCCSCKDLLKYETTTIPQDKLQMQDGCKTWTQRAVAFGANYFNIEIRQPLMFELQKECPANRRAACANHTNKLKSKYV